MASFAGSHGSEYSSKEHFLARAGEIGPWIRHLLLQQPSILQCPWCPYVFPHNKDLTLHLKAHMDLGHHFTAGCPRADVYPLHFMHVRRLVPATSGRLVTRQFHRSAKWADLTRGLLIRAEALCLAAHTFWLKALRKHQHASQLAFASHAVMSTSFLGYGCFTLKGLRSE